MVLMMDIFIVVFIFTHFIDHCTNNDIILKLSVFEINQNNYHDRIITVFGLEFSLLKPRNKICEWRLKF